MELTFKTEKKKTGWRYLLFLPKSLRSTALLSIALNIFGLLALLVFFGGLQQEVPLFYSLPSDQQLVDKKFLFILPGLAALINTVHLLIARLEKEINYNVLKMFIEITFLLQLLVLVILLRIIIILS